MHTVKTVLPIHLSYFRRWQWFIGLSLSAMLFITTPAAFAQASPQLDFKSLDADIVQAIHSAEAQDLTAASSAYQQFKDRWFKAEDNVKASSRQAYRDIEEAMDEVSFALTEQSADPAKAVVALTRLHETNQKFIAGQYAASAESVPLDPSAPTVTIASLIERLDRAAAALPPPDPTATVTPDRVAPAASEIRSFKTEWLEVEGVVATKSRRAYGAIENDTAQAVAALANLDVDTARTTIATLKQTLQPFADQLQYTLIDAAVILLREGLEALLVLVALLAFLNKSGNGAQGIWLWVGAGAGLLASIATALVINLVFANLPLGSNRELLEGFVGLFAAGMLFYVSYWLHSKSALGAWQSYIRDQASSALASNSVFSLALLAFLAVYREGAETVLFYLGIAPKISSTDLLGGLALGTIVLIGLAILMFGIGLKIPLKPFFLVTSILIYYLGFKFVGQGIHALQVGGILPAHTASSLPASDTFGLYPTWETTLVQLALLLVAIGLVLYTRWQTRHTSSNESQNVVEEQG
jgi:high-affinity iron transporter